MNNDHLYLKSLLTTKVFIKITFIGKNLQDILKEKLSSKIANKCISEGYVSSNNIQIISSSAGTIRSDYIMYEVLFECMICHPVEGMEFIAKIKTITKAGIHARIIDKDGNIPITVFVSRDHNVQNDNFHNVKDEEFIIVKVIGIRYEINDSNICAIATFISSYQKELETKLLDGSETNIEKAKTEEKTKTEEKAKTEEKTKTENEDVEGEVEEDDDDVMNIDV